MRLIDADTLSKAIHKIYGDNHAPQGIINLITNAPTIQREGWVSVEDRLPEFTCCVDIFCKDRYTGVLFSVDDNCFYDPYTDCTYDGVTHWQPLPAAPTETE